MKLKKYFPKENSSLLDHAYLFRVPAISVSASFFPANPVLHRGYTRFCIITISSISQANNIVNATALITQGKTPMLLFMANKNKSKYSKDVFFCFQD
jgi:hypothetical protein